ncbi:MAG: protein kinase [Thermoanaerobaculia bacterium]
MTLATGLRLGPYEILGVLGAGGMGEVYRARDTRLGREVAVKVLPATFSSDRDRMRRFEQEARAAGSLNHPNLLSLYDVGTHERSPYLVSELLEGETLRARLASGPLAPRKAIAYAVQIANGLAAAHEKGIVHRDLKPENIFLTRDGRAKILDFGLAKLIRPEATEGGPHTAAPTISGATEPGVILGTLSYMSPEQVRGKAADPRSDIFSFGAILFEMLSGNRAFRGASAADTMSAILKEDPSDLSETARNLPPGVARLVRHCLEKNPEKRFQSVRDLAFDLEALSLVSGTVPIARAADLEPSKARGSRVMAPLAAGIAALVLGFFAGKYARGPTAPGPSPVRVHRLTDFAGLEEFPAVSPDGKSVAFTAEVDGKRQIWVRLIAGGAPLQITRDAADHQFPRWSPDSSSLLYYTPPSEVEPSGSVWETPALGGAPRRLATGIGGADLSHDGKRIVFFQFRDGRTELVVASRDGSAPRRIAQLDPVYQYLYPRWSPDDQWIAYQRGWVFDYDVFLAPAGGGEPKPITREGRLLSGFAWLADSSGIVYGSARGSTMLYLPTFNLWMVDRKGEGLRQLTFGEASYTDPDLNKTGTLVATRTRLQFDLWKYPTDLAAAENARRGIRLTRQTGQVQTPSAGPGDEELVYLADSGGHANLWMVKAASGETRQITYEQDPAVAVGVPVWSPDGKSIAFVSTRNNPIGRVGLWLVNSDGSNPRQVVQFGGWATWSSDARWLYYNEIPGRQGPLMKMPASGGPAELLRKEGHGSAVSPDGSTLYSVIELPGVRGGSDFEIRAASPETGPSRLLARIPAQRVPSWQLFHPVISPDGKSLALPLTDGPTTNIWALSTADGALRPLTDFGRQPTFIARRVSWSSDGRSIFAAVGEGDSDVVLLDGLGLGEKPRS